MFTKRLCACDQRSAQRIEYKGAEWRYDNQMEFCRNMNCLKSEKKKSKDDARRNAVKHPHHTFCIAAADDRGECATITFILFQNIHF